MKTKTITAFRLQHMFRRKLAVYFTSLIYKRKGPHWPAVFPQAAFSPFQKLLLIRLIHASFMDKSINIPFAVLQPSVTTYSPHALICARSPVYVSKLTQSSCLQIFFFGGLFWLILCATLLNTAPWFVVVLLSLFHVFKLPLTEIQVKSPRGMDRSLYHLCTWHSA